jgi:hypothetical protein
MVPKCCAAWVNHCLGHKYPESDSCYRAVLVIARTPAFVFKDKVVTFDAVRDTLGVQYFLEGSVQKAGNRVRITVQLIETSVGAHVWAAKYDGTLSDIFELQDKIIEQLAGALHPSIRRAEIERSRRKGPQDYRNNALNPVQVNYADRLPPRWRAKYRMPSPAND